MSEITKELTIIDKIKVFDRDGKQWTTSLNIAEVFGIAHKNIIQAIENLDCSQEFARLNFQPGKYADKNNQMRKMYDITRDGFTFLAMGFTGPKPAQFKEAYINAFNKLSFLVEKQLDINSRQILLHEEFIREQVETRQEFRALMSTLVNGVVSIGSDVNGLKTDIADVREDIVDVKQQLADVKSDVKEQMDNILSTVESKKRKHPGKTTKEIHIDFERRIFGGQCQCCREKQILDEHGSPIKGVLNWGHMRGPNENAMDKMWPVCASCNSKMSNGKIPDRRTETMFAAYQVQLQEWICRNRKQLDLFGVIKEKDMN